MVRTLPIPPVRDPSAVAGRGVATSLLFTRACPTSGAPKAVDESSAHRSSPVSSGAQAPPPQPKSRRLAPRTWRPELGATGTPLPRGTETPPQGMAPSRSAFERSGCRPASGRRVNAMRRSPFISATGAAARHRALPPKREKKTGPAARRARVFGIGRHAAAGRREALRPPARSCVQSAVWASTTATAVMLTMPRAVMEGLRMWAGFAVPIRIGPTGRESPSTFSML